MNPPAFSEGANPAVAEKWEQEIEKVLMVLQCTDKQRVLYATYFPATVSEAKVVEFLNLTQGNLTVQQYTTKFIELSRFTPYVILDEVKKARIFERGFRQEIYKQVAVLKMQDFSELVDRAIVAEESEQRDVGASGQRKRSTPLSF
ncbi:uncharacterized protein LOC131162892 [Malania oleifera]|uniref:uncharacterized protein LOC131162892 n=1 Tax=Malania oleifera TaxID=397392 RepID=UPI0025AE85EC|nr:uncharacterized protein LOC131162892 [Malania oleifera]